MKLYQATNTMFCAGLVVEAGVVATAAPCLRWLHGQLWAEAALVLGRRGYTVAEVALDMFPAGHYIPDVSTATTTPKEHTMARIARPARTLEPCPVSTDRFTYMPAERMFVCEASALARSPFGRVYADACDVGLTLVSHVTGARVVCTVVGEKYDREGDLQWWDLHPLAADCSWSVRVYND